MAGSGAINTHGGRLYKIVDVSDNTTEVYSGQCRFWGATVHTALSAHVCPITDGTSTIAALAASAAAGVQIDGWGMTVPELHVDPNDAATGMLTVVYEPTCQVT